MLKFTSSRFAFCRLPDALATTEKVSRATDASAGVGFGRVTCASTIGATTTIATTKIAPPAINSRRSSVCLLIDTVLPWPNSVPDSRGVTVTAAHTPAPRPRLERIDHTPFLNRLRLRGEGRRWVCAHGCGHRARRGSGAQDRAGRSGGRAYTDSAGCRQGVTHRCVSNAFRRRWQRPRAQPNPTRTDRRHADRCPRHPIPPPSSWLPPSP